MESDSDEDDEGGVSDEDSTEEEAQRLAMEIMLSGEHPDAEIDKVLESFGVQISQIGLIPTDNFFKGQEIQEHMGEDIRERIDDVREIYKEWGSDKITDRTKRNFLKELSAEADCLGVTLAVEHLLPGLIGII